ncbi:DNA mismatch repair protein MutS [Paenibacillus polysaccharolyticus]|uniref:endonuclease MutS2 n=1 Tax=Paenibacillus polysaccharolyticus TaxID=582692 RepID=UPI00203F566A|nr:DNA mismatch repair protein MutS [Paenibacillus polysaccharolyticus]MCM3133564.1 DNA mismatch repair protein MutS [Paenibacillus polysaccharolyticus]
MNNNTNINNYNMTANIKSSNEQTLTSLGFHHIQKNIADCALSYLGKRYARELKPMTDVHLIQMRLDEAAEATALVRFGASVPIPSLEGMETIINLLGTGYLFSERDFSHLAQFLHSCAQLMKYMDSKSGVAPIVSRYASSMILMESLRSEIERCIHNGRIQDQASKELVRIRKRMTVHEERMKRKLDSLVSKHRSIMQEQVVSQRNGKTVLPIKKEFRKQVKGSVLDESGSGQTVYIEPAELSGLQMELSSLQAEESREEMKILGDLTSLAESYSREIALNTETVGILDFLFAKAKYAAAIDGRSVRVNSNGKVKLQRARHPLMGPSMVPLDFSIGYTYSSLIITGPNTGGKTVALKTLGLLTLMMQSGLLVPVDERGEMAVYEQIAVDIGDGQSLEQALSTFSAHIRNMITILEQANPSTLILIDEMASGTDPGEGVGLSIAMLEELHHRGATVVATTHFGEIKHFASATSGFENARMEFDTASLQPLYRLRIGEAGESYAYSIALKLGMPQHIIARSKSVVDEALTKNMMQDVAKESQSQTDSEHHTTLPVSMEHTDSIEQNAHTTVPNKTISPNGAPPVSNSAPAPIRAFRKGDRVYVAYLDQAGIVSEEEDNRGQIGVMIRGRKLKIHKKRLRLHISADELYPADYDLDIVLESKENRKKRKLMGRKHVEGLQIELPPEE